jgi:hypothetical protein
MRYKVTHPEPCDAGTQIASDGGSIANSPNGPTFDNPPAHSNHPAEPFLKGMHTLARGCPSAAPGYPGSAPPQERFIPEGNAYGGPGFDSARENDFLRGRTMPRVPRFGHYAVRRPARSPRPGLCNPYRIEFCLGPVTRGSHVPWQPRARICKSFRLVPALDVFRWASPNFGSFLGSTTDSRQRPHELRSTTHSGVMADRWATMIDGPRKQSLQDRGVY